MPTYLPLFPLKRIVFPKEILKLHIFEQRYRQLINECLEEKITFGIPAVLKQELSMVFTEMKLESLDKKHGDGRMDITTVGIQRARLINFDRKAPEKLYPGGVIERLEDNDQTDINLQKNVFDLLQELHELLNIEQNIVERPEEVHTFILGHHIGLELDQQIQLLTYDVEIERLQFVRSHLEKIMPIVRETERLRARARLNGHYKNMIPPEI